MRTEAAAAAPLRHVGLVALEALLVAVLVWLAAMTLAGASQSGGLIGTAQAGRDPVTVTVRNAAFGGTAVVTTTRAGDAAWVHVDCTQTGVIVHSQWARLDAKGRAKVTLGPTSRWTSGAAACTAEIGYFSSNGRWRVDTVASFSVTA